MPQPPAASPGAAPAYYMFMEDDFRLCPRGAEALAYLLAKAGATAAARGAAWNAIRVSYGLNGGVIPLRDAPLLYGYYAEHLARRPPDHLYVEWFAGERPQSAAHKAGRPHLAFRYNVLEHFGFTSSLRAEKSPVYPFCYDEMDGRVVFEVEAYKVGECGHEDIWPCPPPGQPVALARSAIPFDELREASRNASLQRWGKQPPG